jgi:hypothetical protein
MNGMSSHQDLNQASAYRRDRSQRIHERDSKIGMIENPGASGEITRNSLASKNNGNR